MITPTPDKFKHIKRRNSLLEYIVWKGMRARCYNKNNPKYKNYGGRGITICDRWSDFWKFYEDMGKRPSKSHSIDRIDVDGDYCPENCRWADVDMQENNRTTTKFVEINGVAKSVKMWADYFGINPSTVRDRYSRGWDVVEALTTPSRKGNYNGPFKN